MNPSTVNFEHMFCEIKSITKITIVPFMSRKDHRLIRMFKCVVTFNSRSRFKDFLTIITFDVNLWLISFRNQDDGPRHDQTGV